MAATSTTRRSRLSFGNMEFIRKMPGLFFFKRHPFREIPKHWVRPASQEAYQQMLEWEGFVTVENWQDDDLTQYPLIMRDLKEAEEHLMPAFWDFNQKAKHYQNNFYFYQWVFIIGAFLTTVAAVITAYFQTGPTTPEVYVPVSVYEEVIGVVPPEIAATVDPNAPEGTTAGDQLIRVNLDSITPLQREQIIALANINQEVFDAGRTIAGVMGWVTLIISLLTTYSATMTNHGEPRKKWNNYRRLTEELRMTYYKYLSHLEPFDKDDRVDVLRRRVLEIRRKELDHG